MAQVPETILLVASLSQHAGPSKTDMSCYMNMCVTYAPRTSRLKCPACWGDPATPSSCPRGRNATPHVGVQRRGTRARNICATRTSTCPRAWMSWVPAPGGVRSTATARWRDGPKAAGHKAFNVNDASWFHTPRHKTVSPHLGPCLSHWPTHSIFHSPSYGGAQMAF